MCDTSEQHVRRCLDGEPEAYRELVRRHEGPLRGYLTVRLGNEEQAREATQEALVRAYFSLDRLRRREAFLPWLLGIGRRVASEMLRARRRSGGSAGLESVAAPPPPADASPLLAAVDGLPEKYRQAIVLRFFGGMSCGEIGRELDIPVGTVTKRLSRAYAMLRDSLGADADDLARRSADEL